VDVAVRGVDVDSIVDLDVDPRCQILLVGRPRGTGDCIARDQASKSINDGVDVYVAVDLDVRGQGRRQPVHVTACDRR
jgi:hypothetical protein